MLQHEIGDNSQQPSQQDGHSKRDTLSPLILTVARKFPVKKAKGENADAPCSRRRKAQYENENFTHELPPVYGFIDTPRPGFTSRTIGLRHRYVDNN